MTDNRRFPRLLSLLCLSLFLFPAAGRAQEEAQQPAPTPGTPATPAAGAAAKAVPATPPKPGPKPYAEVIEKEKDRKTDEGLFIVHRIDDKIFYEIPRTTLGKEMLWVTTLAKTQTGYGYGGTEVQDRVVRWTIRGDKVLLRGTDFQMRSESEDARRAVESSTLEPILLIFDIKAYKGDDKEKGAPVIEATSLFNTDVAEFSAKRTLGASRLDTTRTFIERTKAFPRNIETEVTATYVAAGASGFAFFPSGGGPQRDRGTDAVTVVLRHSMTLLPDVPMKARLADQRVGFFTTQYYDFGRSENRVVERRYINRWRLEKKDPSAALSEPVKPIVFYIGREVPAKWRPYMKKGVEDWQVAFEAAGFKNAILAKDPPTPQEDPEWDAEDSRYSSIRWLPSTIENAYGPSIVDPRSGEILEADIKFFHNILNLLTNWYFIQASPADPKAQRLPLSDETMGELIRYVTAHEVGHSLGFPHNMKASSSVSVAQLRDPEWTNKWGTSASVMDYSRMNYVAQPGDKARLIPKIGPYDIFATEWGYKPLPNARTPDDEKMELDRIAARQVTNPMLRFGNADASQDPGRQTEDIGSDPIEATTLGLKNLSRVLDYIVPATSKYGEDYRPLTEMYNELIFQRLNEIMHVVAVIGGVNQTNYNYGRGPAVYTPVPTDLQRRAVRFLLENHFSTPRDLIRPDILNRIESAGAADRILMAQRAALNSLMSEARAKRMVDQEAIARDGSKPYTLTMLMDDLRRGLWSELSAPGTKAIRIDPYRRNLQRTYINLLGAKIAPPSSSALPFGGGILTVSGGGTQSELRPLSRAALLATKAALQTALKKPADAATRAHLVDSIASIDQFLNPKG